MTITLIAIYCDNSQPNKLFEYMSFTIFGIIAMMLIGPILLCAGLITAFILIIVLIIYFIRERWNT